MPKVGRMLKERMVAELMQRISEEPNLIVAGVNRLRAGDANELRQKLRAKSASLVLAKRRIGLRAFGQLKMTGVDELLEGSVGFILTKEDVSPIAKELVEFVKSHAEQLTVRGGFIDGELLDAGRVEALAMLPPRQTLLAQLVATVELPLSHLIGTIEQLIGDVAYCIEQLAANKPAEAKAEAATAPAEKPQAAEARENGAEGSAETPPKTEQGQSQPTPDEGMSKPEEEKPS